MPDNLDYENNNNTTGLEIAVIGMAGRFPGAENIHALWNLLENGREGAVYFTDSQLEDAGVEPHLLNDPNYVKSRCMIEGAEQFDSTFFGYTPAEATLMDPQLRIFHECAWAALEDAGCNPERYPGPIGFYAGANPDPRWFVDVLNRQEGLAGAFDVVTLNNVGAFSTRIAYNLSLRGPAVTVQTACSTSLTAVHLACQGLLNAECDIAMAGGVALSGEGRTGYLYQEGMIRSSDGRCRAFDADANGTIPGEGVGIVVLKRLDEALEDRDHIYAVIKGSAINNDGTRKIGYTAPSVEGQAEVIRTALEISDVEPRSISYIEAHGTGTALGDPIEIEGLKLAFKCDEKQFCAVGSIKSNIGHLDSSAGIAGFIKTVLAIYHRQIPPSLHYKKPNPKIDFHNSPFYVNDRLQEWNNDPYPLRAGVSAFGIGGTNAHVILEESPVSNTDEEKYRPKKHSLKLFLLSARTRSSLKKSITRFGSYFKENIGLDPADVAYTLQKGRKAFKYRAVIIASELGEAASQLTTLSNTLQPTPASEVEPSVLFLFPGQGSQYINMGRNLYDTEPYLREIMDHCFTFLHNLTGRDFKSLLYPVGGADATIDVINTTEITQPMIFILEYALARLLMSWGICPAAMIGHSIGEYTAACIAEVLSLEDALTLVALRGSLMQSLPAGDMIAIPLPEETLMALIKEYPDVSLAAVNGPSDTVVSGSTNAINLFSEKLRQLGHEVRPLHTSHAFHSAMMDPILNQFENQVRKMSFKEPKIPYLSNLTGTWITTEQAVDPGYYAKHLRNAVRFYDGLGKAMEKEKNAILLEVGPGRVLSTFARRHPGKSNKTAILNLLRHPKEEISDDYFMLEKIGRMWRIGKTIDWEAFFSNEQQRVVPLPTYSFDSQPFRRIVNSVATGLIDSNAPELHKRKDISEWFYAHSWKQVPLPRFKEIPKHSSQHWLIFMDDCEPASLLVKELENLGLKVTRVGRGNAFSLENHGHFILNPGRDEDYESLFRELKKRDELPGRIIHLWGIDPVECDTDINVSKVGSVDVEALLDTGFYSLIAIARSLGNINFINPLQIDIFSTHLQQVIDNECLSPVKATLLGPVKTIPAEYPNITCRSIDIDIGVSTEALLSELVVGISEGNTSSIDSVVALRGRNRWVRSYQPIALPKTTALSPLLKEKGVYLITGGLGGIGLVLARYLAQSVKARLVLIGRSTLPPREEWQGWIGSHHSDDSTALKMKSIMDMEKDGAEVLVQQGDITDEIVVKNILLETEHRFGKPNGLIHSAGIPDGRLIQLRNRSYTKEIIAAKVHGTLLLDRLLKTEELDFVVYGSSLTAVLGSVGQVGYTAANCFLDAFATYKNDYHGKQNVTSINWDGWQEVGMAVDAAARGGGTPLRQKVVSFRFSGDSPWTIAQHRVNGIPTLVGTAYLEMVKDAFQSFSSCDSVEISDIHYLTPLVIESGKELDVRLVFTAGEGRSWQFEFIGRTVLPSTDTDNPWIRHAEGIVAAAEIEKRIIHNLDEIRNICPQLETLDNIPISNESSRQESTSFVSAGPRWKNLKELRFGDKRGLALLELGAQFNEDLSTHSLHPALTDVATAFLMTRLGGESTFLPFSFHRIVIHRALPAKIYSYARSVGKSKSQDKSLLLDITIMNEAGEELVRIEGFSILAVPSSSPTTSLTPESSLKRVPLSINGTAEIREVGAFENFILPAEGIEIFTRVIDEALPVVAVSTVDLPRRFEQMEYFSDSSQKESVEDDSLQAVDALLHPRPELSSVYVSPVTRTQKVLAEIWGEFLGIRDIGIQDDFFELGADSLKALTVIARIHKRLNVEVTIADIFSAPTITALAQSIENAEESIYSSITPVEEQNFYPLSSAQSRLFGLQQMQKDSLFYNLPVIFTVEGDLDLRKLEDAFAGIIKRHESLRTTFHLQDYQPVQIIRPFEVVNCHIPYTDLTKEGRTFDSNETLQLVKAFIRPFSLKEAPLVRLEIIKIDHCKYLWLFDIHHIATDASGYALLQKDLVAFYNNRQLQPLDIRYRDFAVWQNQLFNSGTIDKHKAYWRSVFADGVPRLDLPTDFSRPQNPTYKGTMYRFKPNEIVSRKFLEVGAAHGVTLFNNVMAVLNILLFKYTGQEDIVVGTSIAGRPHADLREIVGMFVNMLAMRNTVTQDMTYTQLLNAVKETALKAFEHQDMQFDMLVDMLDIGDNAARNPLFDVCLNVENYEQPDFGIPELRFEPHAWETGTSKFDMLLWANQINDELRFNLEYSTDLFRSSTAEDFGHHLIEIITQVGENSQIKLKDIVISHQVETPETVVPEMDFDF